MSTKKIIKVKENYDFTEWDEKNLIKLASMMEARKQDFVDAFYNRAKQFSHASDYLKNDKIISHHKEELQTWFTRLFSGPFDDDYLLYLEHIGYAHVKVDLPSHYVNASITFVRKFCSDLISKEIPECDEKNEMLTSLGKILDINLDILTSSYIQEEINIFFVSKKAESKLINFARRFSHGLNLILVLGLVMMGLMVLGLLAVDMIEMFQGDLERGLLATLGAMLMLWVVIELVDTEIDHLQGGRFSIKIFISVAVVALIRKILIITLSSEKVEAQLSLIAALAVLGGLYWIISKLEMANDQKSKH
jgi:uncharacterized membrane protein (DUF373 family)